MSDPSFNEFLHVPARLSIVALLAPAQWMEFRVLRDALDVSDSSLSKQVSALQEAAYVEVRKERISSGRSTRVRLTPLGRQAFAEHAAALQRIVDAAGRVPVQE
ncbi:transcriptional regulator [Actinomadura hibisca]|uniref:transcriptional regulator n=1 Tax=Actinomadura hibisca TaxID=68565 RepID=UPI00083061C0|nr:transcriptional regulator [Actinomadura hibisca]